MTTHVIIPDGHAHPFYNNLRFSLAGQLIADVMPDAVIELGDLGDNPSLCQYDKGKKGFEKNSYQADIAVTSDASERLLYYIKKKKKKMPRRIKLIGNHEQRIERAIDVDPVLLQGTISMKDYGFESMGWEVVPYNGSTPGIITVDDIAYSHYFTSGIMGRPISGEHPAYQLLMKKHQSCVQGHTHCLDMCVRNNASGKKIMGLVSGVFCDYYMDYAGEANSMYWRGLIILRNIENGFGDPEFVSMDTLKAAYGKR